ncbi:hypothetical protein [Roseibium aggregatum]|uniref:hypothetical protein n=1 Tax=Roseibium aggregatum TaxID=187304 RepID=UPI000B08092B|nr:hypothetical protein [Roseibium aggregatum]UFI03452.1 hypothetical protein ST40_026130 [Roseibium aggregatum]
MTDSSGNSFIQFNVPVDWLERAENGADAVTIAYQVGVLELLAISLTVFAAILAFAGLLGFFSVRYSAMAAAREIAKANTPQAVNDYIRSNGYAAIRDCLKEPETVAALQLAMDALGLTDAPEADQVEGDLLESFNGQAA